jgi:hypothetical protein
MSQDEMMTGEVTLSPTSRTDSEVDGVLRQLMESRPVRMGLKENWDPPFDLRVVRPRAIDLRTLWDSAEDRGCAWAAASCTPSSHYHAISSGRPIAA